MVPSWPSSAGGRHQLAGLDGLPAGEVLLQPGQVQAGAAGAEGLRGRLAQQVLEHLQLPLVVRVGAGVGELDLAPAGRDDARQVDDPGHRPGLPGDRGPADGGGGDRLQPGDREPGADAGALVDVAGLADQPGEAGDDLGQVLGDDRARRACRAASGRSSVVCASWCSSRISSASSSG